MKVAMKKIGLRFLTAESLFKGVETNDLATWDFSFLR